MPALALIAAALRGEPVADPPAGLRDAVIVTATEHGVAPLLAATEACDRWDARLRVPLRQARIAEAALAMARLSELRRVIDALRDAGVPVLLVKGAHLARACYPSPECRPHGDVDLLVPAEARASAEAALGVAGYRRLPHVTGEVAFTQVHYWREDAAGVRHAVDLHWRVAAPRVFAERLAWDELYAARIALPAVHPSAAGPSSVHALLLACIHRTAHHRNSERLIWLYDLRLLGERLGAAGWDEFVNLAIARGLAAVALDGLSAAVRWVGATVPERVSPQLAAAASEAGLAPFLDPALRPARVLLSDWRALDGWRTRLRFIREHALPEPAYMAHRYGIRSRAALPFLYAHRLITGAWRWR